MADVVEQKCSENKTSGGYFRKIKRSEFIAACFFGFSGMDRFIRGQIFRGILKCLLITTPLEYMDKVTLKLSNDIFYIPLVIGLVWFLIDFIIAIYKACCANSKFLYFDERGKYIKEPDLAYYFCKEKKGWFLLSTLFGFYGVDRFFRGKLVTGFFKIALFNKSIDALFIAESSNSDEVLGYAALFFMIWLTWYVVDIIIALYKVCHTDKEYLYFDKKGKYMNLQNLI